MKTTLYKLLIGMLLICTNISCNYLDIVPDERPTEDDAFKDKNAAEKYLYSCYAFMPKERQGVYIYQTGEVTTDLEYEFLQGNYSAGKIGNFAFWSKLYGGIKRCYMLINNVDKVPRLEDELKLQYKAEAKFLIAYYHFYLLKAYGPVLIIDKEVPLDMPASEFPKRSTFDEATQWIANMFDEAATDLPIEQLDSYYGRATKVAAKALKGRMLLYAASPLFNGNTMYADLLDPETSTPLISQEYSQAKWEAARDACLEAVTLAEENNFGLYESKPAPGEYPNDPTEYALRMTLVDKNSRETIWADTRREDPYEIQNMVTPRDPVDGGISANTVGPVLNIVKNFYTENGLPIGEDPAYFAESDYYKLGKYDGETTCNLHLNREPRFYAWIGFHNGWYEMIRNNQKRFRTLLRKGDIHGRGERMRDFTKTGYLIKKAVAPSYNTKTGVVHYPWPLVRVAELYLNLAEAAVESASSNTDETNLGLAKFYLNKVRARAGIPSVERAWEGVATLDKSKLSKIVRQERTIELFFEGHYGWDMRRWMEAEKVLNKNPEGLSINEATDEGFFKPATIELAWKFNSPTNYLLPIDNKEININHKIVQNPGY